MQMIDRMDENGVIMIIAPFFFFVQIKYGQVSVSFCKLLKGIESIHIECLFHRSLKITLT